MTTLKGVIIPLVATLLAAATVDALGQGVTAIESRTIPNDDEENFVKEHLGWGYDAIAGRYADSEALRLPIFAVKTVSDPATTKTTGDFRFNRTVTTSIRERSGSSTAAYASSMSANLDLGVETGMFSGEVSASIDASERGKTDSSFVSIDDVRTIFTASLEAGAQVDPDVLKELNSLSAKRVIEKYGTHYTAGLEFGGHITFVHRETASFKESLQNEMMAVKARYEGVSIGAGGSSGSETSSSVTAGSTKLFFRGGKQVGLNSANFFKDGTRDMISGEFSAWAASLRTTPGIAGFLPNGLRPIWTVPGLDKAKARELHEAIKSYAAEKGKGLFDRTGPVAVTKNSSFRLKGENGAYLGGYQSAHDGYYLTTASSGVAHRFATNDDPLRCGEEVTIMMTQGGLPSGWANYTRVSVGNTHTLFYHTGASWTATWKIWKAGAEGGIGRRTGEKIALGDKILIQSMRDADQFIVPSNSQPGYLTTDTKAFAWELLAP
jgi:hypothetical protein